MQRLPYETDDDDKAGELVSEELKNPDPDRWRLMIEDDRVLQTERVLRSIIRMVDMSFTRRKTNITKVRADFRAGKISEDERSEAVSTYEAWKVGATMFRTLAVKRCTQVAYLLRKRRSDAALTVALDSLLALARAVAEHQAAITGQRSAVVADRMLWLRLDTLTFPVARKGHCVPLTHVVDDGDTTSALPADQDEDEA